MGLALQVIEEEPAVDLASLREAPRGVHVCLARMVVVDLGGEKFEEALRGFWRRGKERYGNTGGGRGTS
jgi:hypothetical protein